MHRIDHTTAAVSIPAAEPSGSPGYFREGDPVGGTPATIVTADWANAIQEELINVLVATGITPSKVDNAQLLASISALGGNFAGVVLHASSVTLGAAHIGRLNSLSGNTSQTLTLPLAASVSAGKAIAFIGAGSTAVLTVARSGADYIDDPLGTSAASIALLFGDTLRLVSNGVDRWIPIGGSAALARSSGVFAKLFNAAGYQKLPSGLIIQWDAFDITTTTGAAGSIQTGTKTFPIAFPTSCRAVITQLRPQGYGGTGNESEEHSMAASASTSSVFAWSISRNFGSGSGICSVNYIAIGH